MAQKGWKVPADTPKYDAEDYRKIKIRSNSRCELFRNRFHDERTDKAFDMMTGDNESPILVLEFLAGRMPSRTHLNQSHDDLNPLLDTTIPAQERTTPSCRSRPNQQTS